MGAKLLLARHSIGGTAPFRGQNQAFLGTRLSYIGDQDFNDFDLAENNDFNKFAISFEQSFPLQLGVENFPYIDPCLSMANLKKKTITSQSLLVLLRLSFALSCHDKSPGCSQLSFLSVECLQQKARKQ